MMQWRVTARKVAPIVAVKRPFLLPAIGAVCALLVPGVASQPQSGRDMLLVVNKGDRTLSVFDPGSGRQLGVVPLDGKTGHEVAVSPDGSTAWVPIYGDSAVGKSGSDGRSLSVIDLKMLRKIATVSLPWPARPHAAVFSPRDGRLYVTAELMSAILAIDPVTRKVTATIPTKQPESHMLAISGDGKRAYTANVSAGTVSAIDLDRQEVLAVVPVSASVQRIAISRDDRWVFTADQATPQVAVIDTTRNVVARRLPLPALGYGLATTEDGRRLLVTIPSLHSIVVLDLRSSVIERSIQVPPEPQEVLLRDNRVAYVSCAESKEVAEIDISSGKITKLLTTGAGADGLAWVRAAHH